jgi:outer membrane protein OmpA-like peptidoglycan-associated protein
MSTPPTNGSSGWPAGCRRRRLVLLTVMLAGILAAAAPAGAAGQGVGQGPGGVTSTTIPAGTASSSGTAGQPGVGVDVIPRVVDLVVRTGRIAGGKDTATISESPGTTEVALAADVLFAFDSARLSAAARAELAAVAKRIRERAKGPVRVEGHTDSVGSQRYNLGLSQRRAQAVRDALAGLLTDRPTQYSVRGFGASRPVAVNTNPDGTDNPAGRAKNRRVSVVFAT